MGENKSLKNNVDATSKINDIRLSLNSDPGSKIVWILVEGDNDVKIYPKFFDIEKAKVECVNGGKEQLKVALITLTKETEQVIGIQDADFLHLDKCYPIVKNLFYTDYHDIEMTMLSFEEIICNLFTEYCMLGKKEVIWKNIIQESSHIAYIRWYNDRNNCKILFKGLSYGDRKDGGNLTETLNGNIFLKKQDLLQELNKRSQDKEEELRSENINNFIAINETNDFLNLCNGHDVTALLSLIVGKQVSHIELCRHLRLSFSIQHFSQTKLYSDILEWQMKQGYIILKRYNVNGIE